MPVASLESTLSVGSANVSLAAMPPAVTIQKRRVGNNVEVTWSGITGTEYKIGLYRRTTANHAYELVGQNELSSADTSITIVPTEAIGSSDSSNYPRYAIQIKTESASYIIEDIIKL